MPLWNHFGEYFETLASTSQALLFVCLHFLRHMHLQIFLNKLLHVLYNVFPLLLHQLQALLHCMHKAMVAAEKVWLRANNYKMFCLFLQVQEVRIKYKPAAIISFFLFFKMFFCLRMYCFPYKIFYDDNQQFFGWCHKAGTYKWVTQQAMPWNTIARYIKK